MSENNNPISRIAILRKNQGLTQSKLAELIGVTENTIQNWEKSKGLEQLEKFIKLCKVLGCNKLSDLVDYQDDLSLNKIYTLREQWGTSDLVKDLDFRENKKGVSND